MATLEVDGDFWSWSVVFHKNDLGEFFIAFTRDGRLVAAEHCCFMNTLSYESACNLVQRALRKLKQKSP